MYFSNFASKMVLRGDTGPDNLRAPFADLEFTFDGS